MSRFGLSGLKIGAFRLLAASVFLILAGVSAYLALINSVRIRAPEIALRIDPSDGQALVRDVLRKAVRDGETVRLTESGAEAARTALRQEPLNPRALLILGLISQENGNAVEATKMFRLAESISRRNEVVQLMLVETAVRDGDPDLALRYYDTAMLTSDSADALLFPYLAQAIASPMVRTSLAPYVKNDADWLSEFMAFSLEVPGLPAHWASLVEEAGGLPEKAGYRDLERQMLVRLAAEKDFDVIRSLASSDVLYSQLNFRDISLSVTEDAPGMLDWQLTNDAKTITAIYVQESGSDDEYSLNIETREGAPHSVARKLLLLDPGEYSLRGSYSAEGVALQLMVTCDSDSGSQAPTIRDLPEGAGSFRLDFEVKRAVCAAQYVDVVAASRSRGGVDGTATISSLDLVTPTRAARARE